MSEFDNLLNEQLKDPTFKKEWEDIQPEMDIIRSMIDLRISQNLTQEDLAKRTGINQSDISKIENGTRNPSLKMIKRLADGMGMNVKIVFTPKRGGTSEKAEILHVKKTRSMQRLGLEAVGSLTGADGFFFYW